MTPENKAAIIAACLIVALLSTVVMCGCADERNAARQPLQAIMPANFIKGIRIEKTRPCDRFCISLESIKVDEAGKVWLEGKNALIDRPEEDKQPYAEVMRNQAGHIYVVCYNAKYFSISERSSSRPTTWMAVHGIVILEREREVSDDPIKLCQVANEQ